ncbi:hypothetical protein AB4305_23545 [Nocardia sp. 2YAB30]|uniref:hypothetical protein n=1 Tax=unclassified Nocardia TaxID=2637762 RepID=UPI003F98B9B8
MATVEMTGDPARVRLGLFLHRLEYRVDPLSLSLPVDAVELDADHDDAPGIDESSRILLRYSRYSVGSTPVTPATYFRSARALDHCV